ncbi:MAG TPA: class I SAM-dependent methyltransferase [Nitrososphaerales archaeon]|nr:class I SAM-dependent methyltransferase [Nitrososphaerales archaeon]
MGAWLRAVEYFRRRSAPPEGRLAEAGVASGMRVADLGAGYGYYSFAAAKLVGPEGKVYAVEPDPKRAAEIRRRAGEAGASNVVVVVAGAEDMGEIPDREVDRAISMASFHHFADPAKALAEVSRVVRPGGEVYIRDLKAGRVFRHGSKSEGFRVVVASAFAQAEFEEGKGYLVARIRL